MNHEFINVILGLGVAVPALRARGANTAVLALATVAGLVTLHFAIAALGKLIPVRCGQCRSPSRFRGFGWWPFTYRYMCGRCGHQMGYDIVG